MSSKQDPGGVGISGAVGSSQDPFIRDEGSATEPRVINEESGHPWVGVWGGLSTSHYPTTPTSNSTLSSKRLRPFLVSRHHLGLVVFNVENVPEEVLGQVLASLPGGEGGHPRLDFLPVNWGQSFLLCSNILKGKRSSKKYNFAEKPHIYG